ncbi:hypothetical protein ACFV3R_31835 [Streptomyces sp. NPDC059740]|uniref:hypothetical protein n=1 Tax=Streptomyces sp. NPDC059740 TaxID=3346926 RepID=UPI003668FDD9
MGNGFHANPDVLLNYANDVGRHQEEVPRIGRALDQVDVPAGAFGKLPESDELHTAYTEHAQAAQQDVRDLTDLLLHASETLRAMAGNYIQNEMATEHDFGGDGA